MKWNVYYYSITKRKIETWNVFNHGRFVTDIKNHLKVCGTEEYKKEFAIELRCSLYYYYGSKSEWEVIICPWVGGDKKKDAEKIDIYSQVMMNWDLFLDYIWNNKEELLKEEL